MSVLLGFAWSGRLTYAAPHSRIDSRRCFAASPGGALNRLGCSPQRIVRVVADLEQIGELVAGRHGAPRPGINSVADKVNVSPLRSISRFMLGLAAPSRPWRCHPERGEPMAVAGISAVGERRGVGVAAPSGERADQGTGTGGGRSSILSTGAGRRCSTPLHRGLEHRAQVGLR
jgi:hypothetical protein